MIAGYIDRIEEDVAVILLNDGDYQLNFPAELLPEDMGEGDYINLSLSQDEEKKQAVLAEALSLIFPNLSSIWSMRCTSCGNVITFSVS